MSDHTALGGLSRTKACAVNPASHRAPELALSDKENDMQAGVMLHCFDMKTCAGLDREKVLFLTNAYLSTRN